MIKTYNMVRRHVGDDLAELVIAYIMPEDLTPDSVIASGAGEMIIMLGQYDRCGAYNACISNGDDDLAHTLRASFDQEYPIEDDIEQMPSLEW
jgi:hypothetical protein